MINDSATAEAKPDARQADKAASMPEIDEADAASVANEAAAKAWNRSRTKLLERLSDRDVARDVATLAGMTEIYCADHHAENDRKPFESEATKAGIYPVRKIPNLCPECAAHLRYGEVRRALCRREPRPACKTCANHCYAPAERAWQKRAMAYAGPRAMFRGHAVEAIRHLLQTKLS